MIINKARRLEAVLSGAATPAPQVTVDYFDWTDKADANGNPIRTPPNQYAVDLNGGTDVVILAAPTRNPVSEILRVHIYNADNASVTVTVKTDVAAGGGTEYVMIQQDIPTLRSLVWEASQGWYLL